MRRTEMLQEIRKMRFEEVYFGWSESRLSQEEAARILGVCDRTFRRYIDREFPASLRSGKKFAGGEAGGQTFPMPPGFSAVSSV